MAEGKKSFLLYVDTIHTVEKLSDDQAGKLFKIVLQYVNDLSPVVDDLLLQIAFEPIKQSLKRDLVKYKDFINKQVENGKRGGRPKNPSLSEETQKTQAFKKEPKKADSDIVSDSVIDIVSENKNIPTLEEFVIFSKTIEIYKPELDFSIKSKYEQWVADKWKDGNGNKISNWKTKLKNTIPHLKAVYAPKEIFEDRPKQKFPDPIY